MRTEVVTDLARDIASDAASLRAYFERDDVPEAALRILHQIEDRAQAIIEEGEPPARPARPMLQNRHLSPGEYLTDKGAGRTFREELIVIFARNRRFSDERTVGLDGAFFFDQHTDRYGFEISEGKKHLLIADGDTLIEAMRATLAEAC